MNKMNAKFGQAYRDSRDLHALRLQIKAIRWNRAHLKTLIHVRNRVRRNMNLLARALEDSTVSVLGMGVIASRMSESMNRFINEIRRDW